MATPNTAPAFIRNVGIVGQPVALTNQVCSRDNPGSTPVIIYDPLVESLRSEATGVTAASCLLLFHRVMDEAQPVWRKAGEVQLPSVATAPTEGSILSYPVEMLLPRILFPVAGTANESYLRGLRLNAIDRPVQWGVALTVAVGSAPIIVTMYGGEY
jgi:hypothetical protein